MGIQRFEVLNRAEQSRYVLIDHGDDGLAENEAGEELYLDGDFDGAAQRILFHTGVSDSYAGQGLASVLVQQVVEDVIASGRLIVPVCPYVAAWLPKHPEYAEHVVQPTREHLQALQASQH